MIDCIEKTIQSEYAYKGKTINVRKDIVKLPNGKEALREVVEHPGAVAVVAVNAKREVVMVRQFRYAFGREMLEIPAGKMDKADEGHFACGQRELQEETGMQAGEMTYLGCMYPSVGFLDEVIHLYLAQDLKKTCQNLDEDEFLNVVTLPFEQVMSMIFQNEISDAKTIIGVLKAREFLQVNPNDQ
jgi:ADP-ribose pyrophosphatase